MDDGFGRIAVIGGTGVLGKGLAFRFAKAGYPVIIGSRDIAKAAQTARSLSEMLPAAQLTALGNKEAAAAAEIVILAVPFAVEKPTIQEIQGALSGKILIDATAPLVPPKVSRVQLPESGSAVAAIQAMLGEQTRVVSAFQNVSAEKLMKEPHDIDCDVLVCCDDQNARQSAIALIDKIGLRGIDAGPICNSAAAEAMTSILIWINRKYKVAGAGIRISGI